MAKKQERRGNRARVKGLSEIIVMKGGLPLAGPWSSGEELHKRESLDKILNNSEDKEGGKRRRGNKDDIEEDENGRGQRGAKGAKEETARLTKKMRPGDGNILRSHVKVDFVERNLSYLFVDEKVSEKEGGGRVFTIDPPWTKNPPNIVQDLDQDKDMGESESYRS